MDLNELVTEAISENTNQDGGAGLQMFFVTESDLLKNANDEIQERFSKLTNEQKARFLSLVADEMYDTLTNKHDEDDYFNEILKITLIFLKEDDELDELFEQAMQEPKAETEPPQKKWERILGFSLKADGGLMERLLSKRRTGNLTLLDKAAIFDAILDANETEPTMSHYKGDDVLRETQGMRFGGGDAMFETRR